MRDPSDQTQPQNFFAKSLCTFSTSSAPRRLASSSSVSSEMSPRFPGPSKLESVVFEDDMIPHYAFEKLRSLENFRKLIVRNTCPDGLQLPAQTPNPSVGSLSNIVHLQLRRVDLRQGTSTPSLWDSIDPRPLNSLKMMLCGNEDKCLTELALIYAQSGGSKLKELCLSCMGSFVDNHVSWSGNTNSNNAVNKFLTSFRGLNKVFIRYEVPWHPVLPTVESIIHHRSTLESLHVSRYEKRAEERIYSKEEVGLLVEKCYKLKFLCVAFPKVYYPMRENECLCPHRTRCCKYTKSICTKWHPPSPSSSYGSSMNLLRPLETFIHDAECEDIHCGNSPELNPPPHTLDPPFILDPIGTFAKSLRSETDLQTIVFGWYDTLLDGYGLLRWRLNSTIPWVSDARARSMATVWEDNKLGGLGSPFEEDELKSFWPPRNRRTTVPGG